MYTRKNCCLVWVLISSVDYLMPVAVRLHRIYTDVFAWLAPVSSSLTACGADCFSFFSNYK
ncbi:hypothetical protein GGQ73_004391 [Rhizobium skierniewicense]|uniref:Uncharacterized protein n=1 Tax=Rhizobium skierniewicense TaxID=984260 RepID=A0A7W6CFD2_9HYPH|nr:hypothetical protein [Rhizobium skierniewicense]